MTSVNHSLSPREKIAQIQNLEDFSEWLVSFKEAIERKPYIYSSNPELVEFLQNMAFWCQPGSSLEGYAEHRGIKLDTTPNSLQIFAHLIVSNYPEAKS